MSCKMAMLNLILESLRSFSVGHGLLIHYGASNTFSWIQFWADPQSLLYVIFSGTDTVPFKCCLT